MYFDAHNHLQDERLSAELDEIIAGFPANGIERAVVNGSCEADWEAVRVLAEREPRIIPSFGYHPWYVTEATPGWRTALLAMLDAIPSGVGEIGLDRWIADPDVELQEEIFRAQLRIAAERNLPASIHCLKAWGRMLEVLRSEQLPAVGFLLHSYGGPAEMVPAFAELGAYFSFPGAFLDSRKEKKHAAFRCVPRERLLIETDAPDQCLPEQLDRFQLPPAPDGRRLNHPWNLQAVYEGAASILGWSVEDLEQQAIVNASRLFGRLYRS